MPVATAVVTDPPMPAVGAGLDVAVKGGGATMFDRRHDLELVQTQMPGMRGAIGGAGGAEDSHTGPDPCSSPRTIPSYELPIGHC